MSQSRLSAIRATALQKVERGYVVIVSGAQPGDEPTIEIEEVQKNVAFASIVDSDPRAL